jgi:uncharacterized damage-inducible protein DinB
MKDKSIYSTAPAYYTYYFDLIESNDLLHELRENGKHVVDFIASISDDKWHARYAPEKWTAAEVIRHIIETERVFAYRAMRFSRFDSTPLPGFNENDFIANLAGFQFSKQQTLHEFQTLRESTIRLFETMNSEMIAFMGNANGLSMSAEMLGFMIVGHTKHHCQIIEERYF